MKIVNKTKGTILAYNASIAQTIFKRIIGLLSRSNLKTGEALLIRPCNSVHTFFMRFNIDVVFMDSDNKVIKTICNMRPFRISAIYFNGLSTIELPAGTIQSTNTQEGDILSLE